MRLIDADELIKAIEQSRNNNHHKDCRIKRIHDIEHDHFIKMVSEQQTAFDKEKVKEQIQIFRSKFECTCCPKNIEKHIPVSCDECMDTFAKANIVIVEKGGIE